MTRPDWDNYFIELAYGVARRATCLRKKVGAIVVSTDHRILSTGYNGAPRGMPHCDEPGVGCDVREIDGRGSCVRTLHAESNALDLLGPDHRHIQSCHIYTTVIPCMGCAMRIVQAGIAGVTYHQFYKSQRTDEVFDFLRTAGVSLTQIEGTWADPTT